MVGSVDNDEHTVQGLQVSRDVFDYSDWLQCRGEVFCIYHLAGPGPIRVGDYEGLYYPVAPGHR